MAGMRSTILGAGSWGTALASVLAGKGFPTVLWGRDPAVVGAVASRHENPRYLPGIPLPPALGATVDLARALEGAELVVLAVPSHAVRVVAIEAKRLLHAGTPVVSAAKGIEVETLMTMSEVLEDVLPVPLHPYLCFLGGPSFAKEVAKGLPTAVTIAGRWERVAKQVQEAFHARHFRPYTSSDIVGCEIGGCVKNVVAIAAGLSDGMGFGANARAALITRGLAEIARLGAAMGGHPDTIFGLTGAGDLILTATGDLSRNRRVGLQLAQGLSLQAILEKLGHVAEGVYTAREVAKLAAARGVDMPVTDAVNAVLEGKLSPKAAVEQLLARDPKKER
jgi:glycerol-3-phosphate dehydrogenase (NAD(P)+)